MTQQLVWNYTFLGSSLILFSHSQKKYCHTFSEGGNSPRPHHHEVTSEWEEFSFIQKYVGFMSNFFCLCLVVDYEIKLNFINSSNKKIKFCIKNSKYSKKRLKFWTNFYKNLKNSVLNSPQGITNIFLLLSKLLYLLFVQCTVNDSKKCTPVCLFLSPFFHPSCRCYEELRVHVNFYVVVSRWVFIVVRCYYVNQITHNKQIVIKKLNVFLNSVRRPHCHEYDKQLLMPSLALGGKQHFRH